jgi:hypothetical protein
MPPGLDRPQPEWQGLFINLRLGVRSFRGRPRRRRPRWNDLRIAPPSTSLPCWVSELAKEDDVNGDRTSSVAPRASGRRSQVRFAIPDALTLASTGLPVFRAYGDDDDHLRLSVLIARALEHVDREACAICLRPNTPWQERLEALEGLLNAFARSTATPGAVFIDPDGLAPEGISEPWEDPGFRHERRAVFDAILRAARRGGWVLFRPWPRADLAEEFEELPVAIDDEPVDEPLLDSLAPAARPLARWLRSRGTLSERRLRRLVEDGQDPSRVVLEQACQELPASTARAAQRLALVRPPQELNGHIGPFAFAEETGERTLPRAEVDRLRSAGFLEPGEKPTSVVIASAIRRALLITARTPRSDAEVASDHTWLGHSFAARSLEIDMEAAIEAHHHAVEAGDLEAALRTAIYYGADLRTLAFRLGRAAATQHDRQLFRRAAEIYRAVLDKFDKLDAYSWEYFAFNLARSFSTPLAADIANEVEAAYVRAHELAPANPLFHGRLVGFRAELGRYDRGVVERTLARYRASEGPRGVAFFGQTVSDGLRRAGRPEDATDLARRWQIVPPERTPHVEVARRPRRFGSAAGTIMMAEDFDEPLADFAPYE